MPTAARCGCPGACIGKATASVFVAQAGDEVMVMVTSLPGTATRPTAQGTCGMRSARAAGRLVLVGAGRTATSPGPSPRICRSLSGSSFSLARPMAFSKTGAAIRANPLGSLWLRSIISVRPAMYPNATCTHNRHRRAWTLPAQPGRAARPAPVPVPQSPQARARRRRASRRRPPGRPVQPLPRNPGVPGKPTPRGPRHGLPRASPPVPAPGAAPLRFLHARGATLRHDLINVAARTARHGRSEITLHLPEGWHREQDWMTPFEAACGLPAQAA